MNKSNEMEVEIRALRERLSKLNSAVLRISSSLDLDTVLREVVASARALTDGTAQFNAVLPSGVPRDRCTGRGAGPESPHVVPPGCDAGSRADAKIGHEDLFVPVPDTGPATCRPCAR